MSSTKAKPKRILLLGVDGLLGCEVMSQIHRRMRMTESVYANAIVYAVKRNEDPIRDSTTRFHCDLSNPNCITVLREAVMSNEQQERTVESIIGAMAFDMVINCAAMTDSAKCNEHPEKAYNVNCYSPLRIYEEARSVIHILTPAVYTGIDGNYVEDSPYVIWGDAPTNTRKGEYGVYRESKALIEQKILESPQLKRKTTILRGDVIGVHRSNVYSRPNLIEGVLKNLIENGEAGGLIDAIFSPVPAKYYAETIVAISEDILRSVSGVFHAIEPDEYSSHYTGYGVRNIGVTRAFSKYEIVKELAGIVSTRMNVKTPTVNEMKSADFGFLPTNYSLVTDSIIDLQQRLRRNDPMFESQTAKRPISLSRYLEDMVDDYIANKQDASDEPF